MKLGERRDITVSITSDGQHNGRDICSVRVSCGTLIALDVPVTSSLIALRAAILDAVAYSFDEVAIEGDPVIGAARTL